MHFSDLHAPGPPTFLFSHWPAGGPWLVGVWGGHEPDLLLSKHFYNWYFTREGGGGGRGTIHSWFNTFTAEHKKTVLCIQGATHIHWRKDSAHIGEYNASHYWIFYQNKKPIWKILRTDKNNNFKFTIKFLMTLDMLYIGYLGFLGIDLFKSVVDTNEFF